MVEARREDERYGFVRTRDAAFGDDLDRVVAEGMLPARRRVEIRNDAPMDLRLEACVLPVKVEHAADPSELLAEFAGGLVGLSLRWRLDDPFSDDTMVTRARSVVRVCGTPARRAVESVASPTPRRQARSPRGGRRRPPTQGAHLLRASSSVEPAPSPWYASRGAEPKTNDMLRRPFDLGQPYGNDGWRHPPTHRMRGRRDPQRPLGRGGRLRGRGRETVVSCRVGSRAPLDAFPARLA